jgi:hypothetical protein
MARMKHPHSDRVAEVYERGPNLKWLGYTAEPIVEAEWRPELQAWVLPAKHDWRPDVRWSAVT